MKIDNSNNLSERLHLVVAQETDFIHAQLSELGLNNQQARLLKYVSEHPGTIQKDVAEYLNRQNATVTNMLKLMAKRGYIVRKIPADNERQKQIFLEPKGEKLLGSINATFASLEAEIESAVPQKEQAAFIRNLERITKKLEQ
ncbi:hypothetical protein AYR54_08700 [Loigolactobacillus backii]|uniref:MarR family winged helix-turn-helix transcriptional regulator n=1 Tax=Loigolactobacillus backii TaxID=375175 RepID=UPI0007F09408|nr:MarR family transcriptional regulator [Loigolactobacillus backii]ANK65309.1 hypothetical protein AYR54_08700 [Loigolactobacillus backii]ANK67870.1 hypothetical protein AYR55_09310 [Loigolactobacillus backii]